MSPIGTTVQCSPMKATKSLYFICLFVCLFFCIKVHWLYHYFNWAMPIMGGCQIESTEKHTQNTPGSTKPEWNPFIETGRQKKNCSQHCFIHPPFEHFSPISKKIDFFYVFFTTKNIELGLSISKYWLVVMVVMVVMVIIANCRYLT